MTAGPALFPSLVLAASSADAPVRIVAREWFLQPVLSLPIWCVVAALAVALAVAVYRGGRARIPVGRRITLMLLRSGALLLAAGLLLQPTMRVRLERASPHPLAILVDTSGSMAVQDRADQPRTRWDQIIETLNSSMPPDRLARAQLVSFNEQVDVMSWSDLSAPVDLQSGRYGTDIAAALRTIRDMTADRPETQIVLVSDGADTVAAREGSLLAAAREIAQAGLTLHTVLVGEDRLPAITVETTADRLYAFVDDPIRVQVRLTAERLNGSAVDATITADGRPLAARRVTFSADAETMPESFDLVFDRTGLVRCRFEVPSNTPPIILKGNPAFDVQVIDKPVRVLYIERRPRWTFQFLRNAFQRDHRFDARLVLVGSDGKDFTLPAGNLRLDDTGVVILGDFAPQELPNEWWQNLRDAVVNDGVGLILAAGPDNLPARFLDSALAELLPFRRLDSEQGDHAEPWLFTPTPAGRIHAIMQMPSPTTWDTLPGLYWHAPIRDIKPAAQVLAEKPATPDSPASPIVLLQRAGRGTVLFVGTDETWRWRYELGDAFFYRFWAQASLFAGLPHQEPSAITTMPTSTQPADSAFHSAEMADVSARPDLMKRLARETGGECVPLCDLPGLLETLDQQPVRERWAETRSVWDRWPTLVILVAILCTEWLLRRRSCLP